MKKFAAWIMIIATVLFLGYSAGFFAGRDQLSPVLEPSPNALPNGTLARAPLPEQANSQPKINLNTATREELILLPGIGEAISQRILDYRTEIGSFRTVSEIMGVSGIGEKTLEKLEPYLYVE